MGVEEWNWTNSKKLAVKFQVLKTLRALELRKVEYKNLDPGNCEQCLLTHEIGALVSTMCRQ